MQTLFTFEYLLTLSYIYKFKYIAYEHIHLAPASSTSVKYTQLLVKVLSNSLIYQQSQLERPYFV